MSPKSCDTEGELGTWKVELTKGSKGSSAVTLKGTMFGTGESSSRGSVMGSKRVEPTT